MSNLFAIAHNYIKGLVAIALMLLLADLIGINAPHFLGSQVRFYYEVASKWANQ